MRCPTYGTNSSCNERAHERISDYLSLSCRQLGRHCFLTHFAHGSNRLQLACPGLALASFPVVHALRRNAEKFGHFGGTQAQLLAQRCKPTHPKTQAFAVDIFRLLRNCRCPALGLPLELSLQGNNALFESRDLTAVLCRCFFEGLGLSTDLFFRETTDF